MQKISSLLLLIAAGMIQASIPPLQIQTVVIDQVISCLEDGSTEANITVEPLGGQPPYEFQFGSGPFTPSKQFTTNVADILRVTVRDSALPTPNETSVEFNTGISALNNIIFLIDIFPCDGLNGSFSVIGAKRDADIVPTFILTRNGVLVPPSSTPVITADQFRVEYANLLAPGEYLMTVSTTGGGAPCVGAKNTYAFTVKELAPVVISSIETLAADTPVVGGSIRINITGGGGNFLFNVEGVPAQLNNPVFSNLEAGTFDISVADLSSTCTTPVTATATVDTFANAIAQFLLTKNC